MRLMGFLIALLPLGLFASSIKLRWNPNPESDIAGYTVHYGTDGSLDQKHETGNVTTTIVADLEPFVTYTFGLTATNTSGLTSDMSETITVTMGSSVPRLDMTGSEVVAFSSQEITGEDAPAAYAIDGKRETIWHSEWKNNIALPPHYIAVKLPKDASCSALYYLPRQDNGGNGRILQYEIESSMDGDNWEAWASGDWRDDEFEKVAQLPLRIARYVRIWGNEAYCSMAELGLAGSYVPDPPSSMVRLTLQRSPNRDLASWEDIPHEPVLVPAEAADFFRIKIEKP